MKVSSLSACLLALTSIIFLLIACTKDPSSKSTKDFEVLEGGSNIPLSGVQVMGYKCQGRDFLRNCLNQLFVSTATTNEKGIASFPESAEIGSIKISKDQYWDNLNTFDITSGDVTYLYPKAIQKVRFIRINPYILGERLIVISQEGKRWDEARNVKELGLPADTTLYLKGRGNMENKVEWAVLDRNGNSPGNQSPEKIINRFDTASFEIRY